MKICTSNQQKNSQVNSARLKKKEETAKVRMKQQIVHLQWLDGKYSCSDLYFFHLFLGKKISGHRITSKWQPEIYNRVVLLLFPYCFLGWAKCAPIQTHFWSEPQNIRGTTGWESRTKKERRRKKCGLANALQDQVSMLLAFLTWVCTCPGRFLMCCCSDKQSTLL